MIGRLLAICIGASGAVFSSQLPEFSQQYRQRMGGAIDALKEVQVAFEQDAAQFSMSVSQALDHMKASADGFVQERAESVSTALQRLESLEEQREAMATSGSYGRIWTFVRSPDAQLSKATWSNFEPAVPVTVEGLTIAGLGFAGGLGVYWSLALGARGARARAKRKTGVTSRRAV
ncbi:DUF2937 family protein [Rhodobacteraceae bacterium RKSG542]|uniref:DUF2937 family protein n=1 Tax=Pseudovibrio flavus TaxID=2529854 RepID=UPI0012BD696D|nr:DUF2937 family protein [Pseudovibrio flavus]MTI16895.1 DUF2937 family protein [Pseudovibrio flavus]